MCPLVCQFSIEAISLVLHLGLGIEVIYLARILDKELSVCPSVGQLSIISITLILAFFWIKKLYIMPRSWIQTIDVPFGVPIDNCIYITYIAFGSGY